MLQKILTPSEGAILKKNSSVLLKNVSKASQMTQSHTNAIKQKFLFRHYNPFRLIMSARLMICKLVLTLNIPFMFKSGISPTKEAEKCYQTHYKSSTILLQIFSS